MNTPNQAHTEQLAISDNITIIVIVIGCSAALMALAAGYFSVFAVVVFIFQQYTPTPTRIWITKYSTGTKSGVSLEWKPSPTEVHPYLNICAQKFYQNDNFEHFVN